MTATGKSSRPSAVEDDPESRAVASTVASGGGATTGMRLIVPLQSVVHGRGGIVLGSAIPCVLLYFLQLYLKRNRSVSSKSPSSQSQSTSSAQIVDDTPALNRCLSRSYLSMRSTPVSTKIASILKAGDSPFCLGTRRYAEDPFNEVCNLDGVIQLGFSGNRLLLDLIGDWIDLSRRGADFGNELRSVGLNDSLSFDGSMELKIAVAGFMSRVLDGVVSFDPQGMILTGSLSSAIETLCFCISDVGNAFLLPAPYSPSLDYDLKWRTGLEVIPVPCRSSDGFSLCITALDRAFNHAKKRGVRVRGVLISNPSNPVGGFLNREVLLKLLDFAREKNIHIISNEMFLGSLHGHEEFTSMAEFADRDADRDRVHVIYGLSDDLSLPGFGLGVVYSLNRSVIGCARNLSRSAPITGFTEKMMISMLSDLEFMKTMISTCREKAQRIHRRLKEELKKLHIESVKGGGGYSCWVNMSGFMGSYSEKGELELWNKLLNTVKVNTVPGSMCHCIEPGWFQFGFGMLTEDQIPILIGRIREVTEACRQEK